MWDDVDWSVRGSYMQERHGITPAEADEALQDQFQVILIPDPASTSGRGIRVIGWAESTGRLVTVIVLEDTGTVYGVNGWPANPTDQNRYNTEGTP